VKVKAERLHTVQKFQFVACFQSSCSSSNLLSHYFSSYILLALSKGLVSKILILLQFELAKESHSRNNTHYADIPERLAISTKV